MGGGHGNSVAKVHGRELKQKAVELYGKSGTTCAEVARGLGCDAGSLSDWAMNADAVRPALDANWIGYPFLGKFQRARPAFLNSTGLM